VSALRVNTVYEHAPAASCPLSRAADMRRSLAQDNAIKARRQIISDAGVTAIRGLWREITSICARGAAAL